MKSEWILVKDRLPPKDEEVLIAFMGWDDMVFCRVAELCSLLEEWTDWTGESYKGVIAWQELPSTTHLPWN